MQWVNPLAAGSGAVNPGADFSPAQAQKQWLAGWTVVKSVLDALVANLSLTPKRCASLYVLYGYDCSVPEAVMRMSSVLSVQTVTVSWADLDSDNHTAGRHLCEVWQHARDEETVVGEDVHLGWLPEG